MKRCLKILKQKKTGKARCCDKVEQAKVYAECLCVWFVHVAGKASSSVSGTDADVQVKNDAKCIYDECSMSRVT